tara:strand:+ start:279 stop:884 length:606 start_codon:yes stop_codon:yes gene_type:complete
MAYRQTPGRGPTAAFKNVTALLGPTVTEGIGEGEKEKVTRTTKEDVNPETGMKRFTFTTTREGGSPGSKGIIGYEEAYKKADKSKYPTLEKFTKAAKAYNKKDVKVEELIPTREAKITTSSEPKLRTIETTKKPTTTTTTTKKKKGQNKLFDGSGKRKIQGKINDFKATCKQGFFRKGSKCVAKGEKSIRKELRKRKRKNG